MHILKPYVALVQFNQDERLELYLYVIKLVLITCRNWNLLASEDTLVCEQEDLLQQKRTALGTRHKSSSTSRIKQVGGFTRLDGCILNVCHTSI